ncbi:MAG: hypothetical protein ABR540_16765 [Acidimicrobiales bacterium]
MNSFSTAYPPSPGESPPAPIPPPPPMAEPSRRGYFVAGLIAVIGLLLGGIGLVRGFGALSDRVDEFERVEVPGAAGLTFDTAGDFTLYFEAPGTSDATSNDALPAVQVLLEPAGGGDPVPIKAYGGSVTYTVGGHEGRAVGTFHIDAPGDYKLSSDASISPGFAQIAVGTSLRGPLAQLFLSGLILFVAFAAAVVVSVVTAVRRRRARRRLLLAPPA